MECSRLLTEILFLRIGLVGFHLFYSNLYFVLSQMSEFSIAMEANQELSTILPKNKFTLLNPLMAQKLFKAVNDQVSYYSSYCEIQCSSSPNS